MNDQQLQVILRTHLEESVSEEAFSSILSAMREAVQQGSIGFANWLQFNYQPHAESGYWYNHHDDQRGLIPLTTEQLYQEYLKSIEK